MRIILTNFDFQDILLVQPQTWNEANYEIIEIGKKIGNSKKADRQTEQNSIW